MRVGIDELSIGIDYADESKSKDFSDETLQRREKIQKELKANEHLPDDIKVFITTSKNKEGININNEDIKIMFAESCQRAELIQMAGRVRSSLEYFFIIYDSYNTSNFGKTSFEATRDKNCLEMVNLALQDYEKETERIMEHGDPLELRHRLYRNDIIQNIENTFPNIRYNPFTQAFMLYEGRIQGNYQMMKDTYSLIEYIENWDSPVYVAISKENPPENKSSIDFFALEENETGEDQFKFWFPYSNIELWRCADNPIISIHEAIKKLLIEKGCLDVKISKEQRENLASDIRKILPEYDYKKVEINPDFKQLGPLLKKVGFKIEDVGSHKTGKEKFKIRILEGWEGK